MLPPRQCAVNKLLCACCSILNPRVSNIRSSVKVSSTFRRLCPRIVPESIIRDQRGFFLNLGKRICRLFSHLQHLCAWVSAFADPLVLQQTVLVSIQNSSFPLRSCRRILRSYPEKQSSNVNVKPSTSDRFKPADKSLDGVGFDMARRRAGRVASIIAILAALAPIQNVASAAESTRLAVHEADGGEV